MSYFFLALLLLKFSEVSRDTVVLNKNYLISYITFEVKIIPYLGRVDIDFALTD